MISKMAAVFRRMRQPCLHTGIQKGIIGDVCALRRNKCGVLVDIFRQKRIHNSFIFCSFIQN